MTYVIDRVQSITATDPRFNAPDTYIVVVDWHEEGSPEMNVGDSYGLLPDDPIGMAPTLRQWMIDHQGEYTVLPAPAPVARPYQIAKTTPWLRMTDPEGDLVYAAMSETSSRLRAISDAATYLSSDDPLWSTMHDILAATLSPERADQLLAPET
jgi:hypothetical protein